MPVKIPLSVDQQQLLNELIKQRDSWGKIENAVKDLGKTADKEEKNRLRQAKAIIRSQRDEQEVLADKIAVLRRVGREDETQKAASNRAIKRLIKAERDRVAGVQDAARKASTAYKEEQRLIDAGVKKVGQLKTANQSLEQQHNELKVAIKAAFKAGKIGADDHRKALSLLNAEYQTHNKRSATAFSPEAIGRIKAFATGVISISAAYQLATRSFEEFEQRKEDARQASDRLLPTRKRILSVSDTSEELNSRLSKIDSASGKFGIDREQVGAALFDAISNGIEKDFGTVLRASLVIPSDVSSKFAGEFRQQFKGDNLTAEQAINTGLTAAQTSNFDPLELLPQLQKAAQGSATLPGVSAADVSALTSSLAGLLKGETGQNIKSLQANFGAKLIGINEKIKVASPEEIPELQAQKQLLSGDLLDIIGNLGSDPRFQSLKQDIIKDNKELLTAFSVATKALPIARNVKGQIIQSQNDSGTERSPLNRKINAALENGQLFSKFTADRAKQANEVANENENSVVANRESSVRDFVNKRSAEQGKDFFARFLINRSLDLNNLLGFEPEKVLSSSERKKFQEFQGETRSNFTGVSLNKTEKVLESIDKTLKSQNKSNRSEITVEGI